MTVSSNPPPVAGTRPLRVALAGNPNAGKSTLFNALTGLRQKVANYPGVTVEKKVGRYRVEESGEVEVIDLPGTYSLSAQAPDEEIARDILFGWRPDTPAPDVVVVVVDATHLERNLYLATQIIELGLPTVLALNMADLAQAAGLSIDVDRLSHKLGVPVVKTVASKGVGVEDLKAAVASATPSPARLALPERVAVPVSRVARDFQERHGLAPGLAYVLALRFVTSPQGVELATRRLSDGAGRLVQDARDELATRQWQGSEAAERYNWVREVVADAVTGLGPQGTTLSDRVDRILTHRVWGLLIFGAIMGLVFQSIFTWAQPFMDGIQSLFAVVSHFLKAHLPAGILTDLLTDGVLTGVGSVLVFVPQIAFLFFFLAILEDSGYLVRPAFALDRFMRRFGLSGRSLIPLLSSFACAIPGIMSTRTISNKNDRLLTILIAPLMTCSARLPVYTLMIAAFVPSRALLWGFFSAQGLSMLALYLLGIVGALVVAAVFKRTILKSTVTPLMLELPPYRRPALNQALREVWLRAGMFVRTAGTLILSLSIILWFLSAFPRANLSTAPDVARTDIAAAGQNAADPDVYQAALSRAQHRIQLEQSMMGHMGHAIEPVVRPLGFDWKIGVGLVASFAAREVMVSTLGILYTVDDVENHQDTLVGKLREATTPGGAAFFTPAVVCSLLVFYVFACQCMSTVSVVVKETGGWKWPAFMVSYMMVLAYVASFSTYHGMRLMGWG